MFEKTGKRPVVYNNKCGQLCGVNLDFFCLFFSKNLFAFQCWAKEVDAIEYYEKLYEMYKENVEREYSHVREKKCGLAFLTFSTPAEAHR